MIVYIVIQSCMDEYISNNLAVYSNKEDADKRVAEEEAKCNGYYEFYSEEKTVIEKPKERKSLLRRIGKALLWLVWDDTPAAMAEAARYREKARLNDMYSHSCSRATF